MTEQEMFDRVKAHLLVQNKKSIIMREDSVTVQCAYRGEGNLKCAIGCLIPDELYNPEFDKGGSAIRWNKPAQKAAGITAELLGLAAQLQGVHDHYEPADWPARLQLVAKAFELTP